MVVKVIGFGAQGVHKAVELASDQAGRDLRAQLLNDVRCFVFSPSLFVVWLRALRFLLLLVLVFLSCLVLLPKFRVPDVFG